MGWGGVGGAVREARYRWEGLSWRPACAPPAPPTWVMTSTQSYSGFTAAGGCPSRLPPAAAGSVARSALGGVSGAVGSAAASDAACGVLPHRLRGSRGEDAVHVTAADGERGVRGVLQPWEAELRS